MKKVIVIASAVILIFAIYRITIEVLKIQDKLPREFKDFDPYAVGMIIVFLLVALVASAAIFDSIPAKAPRIWLIAASVLSPMIIILLLRLLIFGFLEGYPLFKSDRGSFLFLTLCLGSVAVIITSVANIRRALRKDGVPADEIEKAKESK